MKDYPVGEDEIIPNVADRIDEIGSSQPPEYDKLVPVENSEQKGIAGKGHNVKKIYVGHVAYSPDYDCLVYQVEKESNHLLNNVEGKGISITKRIINKIKDKYRVEYVFVGLRETGNVLIIPIENFDKEWHTKDYDKQLYARLDKDVMYEVPNSIGDILSPMPSEYENSIPKEEALSNDLS